MDVAIPAGVAAAVSAIVLAYKVNKYRLSKLPEGDNYSLQINEKDGGMRIIPLDSNGNKITPDSDDTWNGISGV